jgi:acyl-CoA synthetase (AMP-forming)/AMP-acid ligase II
VDRSTRTLDRMLAAAVRDRPDHSFLIWQGESVSYREFDEMSNRAARAWQRLGVRTGDKVVFMLDNSPEFLVGWFGLAKIGATLVAVNTRFQAGEALYVVQDSGARVVLTDSRCREVVRSVHRQYDGIDTVLMAGAGSSSGDQLLFDLCRREDLSPLDGT